MKNCSKKHRKLFEYYILNCMSPKVITQQQIALGKLYDLTYEELYYMVNDKWHLFI